MNILEAFKDFFSQSGIVNLQIGQVIMIFIALVLIYLAVKKGFEPYLLLPIAFGAILVNLPLGGLLDHPFVEKVGGVELSHAGGLMYYLYQGIKLSIFPPIIFLGVGAMTDFGPLIANPKSFLLGAAAQFGIFAALIGAVLLGFPLKEAASIGIIGGADGPTSIFLTGKLAPDLLGPIAIAAYSYMALVPIIQPPIIKLLTTKQERQIKMEQLREVSRLEKIMFPLATSIIVILIVPSSAPLIGMLMFGNLIKESGVVPHMVNTAGNAILYTITIFLGLGVGTKMLASEFLKVDTLKILVLGLIAFSIGTASGVLFAKLMNKLSKSPINPMIGAAGVSAVPMAARVVQKVGQEENPSNFLLMHAMGPNVAGVIGSAVAAGALLILIG